MTEVLGAVVRLEPTWDALASDVPRPSARSCSVVWSKIAAIAWPTSPPRCSSWISRESRAASRNGIGRTAPRPLWRRVVTPVAAALVASAVVGAAVWFGTRPIPPRMARFPLTTASADALSINGTDRDLAITPDGLRVVYVGRGGAEILMRSLDQIEPIVVARGLVRGVFVSPDGQWVGFTDNNRTLKKVAITGGPPLTLTALDGGARGATWAPEDTILFATNNPATGLQRVSAAGGEPTVVTRPNRDRGEADHLWPEILPGGRGVLFTMTAVSGGLDAAQIAVLDLDTGAQTIVLRGGSHAHYVSTGHLVYTAGGALRAVAFDLSRREIQGTPVSVLPRVMTTAYGAGDYAVAADGTLVYVDAPGTTTARLRR